VMKRSDFLRLPEVIRFTDWLVCELPQWPVQLQIASSKFVPQGLHAKTVFGQLIPQQYRWRAAGMLSGDWAESCAKTHALSRALRAGVAAADAPATMRACSDILLWGGERNAAVGARPFLLAQGVALPTYIAQTGRQMSLDEGDLEAGFPAVKAMNSMLTKVHAFYSQDGLPIYDSRVSAAIAALVEYWRQAGAQSVLPRMLQFPLAGGSAKPQHKLQCLFEKPMTHGQLIYNHAATPARWAGAKLRLAWIMAEVLRKAPHLFAGETNRMRAMEAALFMVGYDLRSLRTGHR
jgi:hypothetical protein